MSDHSSSNSKQDTFLGNSIRFLWLVAGAPSLCLIVAILAQQPAATRFLYDRIFWGIVIAMALLRFVDIRYFGGLTFGYEVATMKHWRRYVLVLFGSSLVVWLIALFASSNGFMR